MSGRLVFDLEATGLDPAADGFRIHCICGYNLTTQREFSFYGCEIDVGLDYLFLADELIGHNLINFDIPVIAHFRPNLSLKSKVTDTLVLARLAYPKRKSNALKVWGQELGILKGDFNESTDWKEFTTEMLEYCKQDVRVTKALYNHLMTLGLSEQSVELGHQVAPIIDKMCKRGVEFDLNKATKLYCDMEITKYEITRTLQTEFGDNFNPGSTQQVAKALIKKYNWRPTLLTPTGKPKVDGVVLDKLDYPEAKLLVEYGHYKKYIGQIATGKESWINSVKNGRIHGYVNSNGTITGRMTHSHPNLAQVPAGYSWMGKECRELFVAKSGHILVGCDAAGLEARLLAHYVAEIDNGEMADLVINGDIHTNTMNAINRIILFDLPRNDAKAAFYAWVYRCSDTRMDQTVGSSNKGALIKQALADTYPAVEEFCRNVEDKAKERMYLLGLDRRRIPIEMVTRITKTGKEFQVPDAPVNYLIQSAGAILMKKALTLVSHLNHVLNVHDEMVVECLPEEAKDVGRQLSESITKAGELLGLKCPMAGEYKIGNNWSELK